MKKLISILLVCVMVTGCSARQENSDGSVADATTVSKTESSSSAAESSITSSAQNSSAVSSVTSKTSDVTSSSSSTSAVSSSASSTTSKDNTSTTETSTSSEDSTSAASSNVSTSSAPAPAEPTPAWSEETIDTADVFVNTQGIYSRKNAIVGSERVKLYNLNDKVTVVAKTDTGYYKLEDGSFIHKDYLSDKETPKPVETPKPSNPSQPSAEISADITTLLNNAPLNPMITNEAELDELITDILNEIITDDMTTAQKVKAIYDYIIQNYTYGRTDRAWYTDANYHEVLDSMITSLADTLIREKQGVCTNYSALFVVLTRRIGLESYWIEGEVKAKAGGMTGHAWTVMKLDEQYYIFDPQVEQNNLVNGKIMYNYYGILESSMMPNVYRITPDSFSLIETCKMLYHGESYETDNGRDFCISFFGNFVVDEGERPYNWSFVNWD